MNLKGNKILLILLVIALGLFINQYLPLLFVPRQATISPRVLSQVERIISFEESSLEAESLSPIIDPFALRVPVRKLSESQTEKKETNINYVPKSSLILGGIWVYGEVKYALIGDDSAEEGDLVEGWKVTSIQSDKVVLYKDGQRKTLKLED